VRELRNIHLRLDDGGVRGISLAATSGHRAAAIRAVSVLNGKDDPAMT